MKVAPRLSVVRDLTQHESALIAWLLENGSAVDSAYRSQAVRASVVGQCGCGCGSIDLAIGARRAVPGAGLQVVVDAQGIDPSGHEVAVILFASDGVLSCLEVYSPAGIDGVALPTLESVAVT